MSSPPEDWEARLAERDGALNVLTATCNKLQKENYRLTGLLLELDAKVQQLQREARVAWNFAESLAGSSSP